MKLNSNQSGAAHIAGILAVVVIAAIGVVGWKVWQSQDQKTFSKTKTTDTTSVINSWTGKAKNYNWNEAANWSLGIPKNNQSIEIDVSKVTQPTDQYGATSFAFQNNITNLTINKLIFDGQVDSIITGVKGNPITITGGIEDTISGTNPKSAIPQVQIISTINFAGDALIKTTGRNLLTFYNEKDTAINLGDKTIQFSSSDTSSIDVSGALVGTGTIKFADVDPENFGSVTFRNSSPDYNGKVIIGSGNTVSVGNATATGYGSVDALGSSSIAILSGGALYVFAHGTDKFSISNDIAVSGKGVTGSDGSVSGAVSACVTMVEQGCSNNGKITFTGSVKLLGDTQIGRSTPASLGSKNLHIDYSFNNLNKNGHTLTTITDYNYQPRF